MSKFHKTHINTTEKCFQRNAQRARTGMKWAGVKSRGKKSPLLLARPKFPAVGEVNLWRGQMPGGGKTERLVEPC